MTSPFILRLWDRHLDGKAPHEPHRELFDRLHDTAPMRPWTRGMSFERWCAWGLSTDRVKRMAEWYRRRGRTP